MTGNPWYREPWPWLLMAGPAIVVVAGIVTLVIAVVSFDGMVADDYYKQGLGVNRVIAREAEARALGIEGAVQFNAERTRVRVVLRAAAAPKSLRLALVHPTLPAEDQALELAQVSDGVYEGALRPPRDATLRLVLEDADNRWRLAGSWTTHADAVRLAPP
jgi:hypothetical protein